MPAKLQRLKQAHLILENNHARKLGKKEWNAVR